jgi:hypothetical protein
MIATAVMVLVAAIVLLAPLASETGTAMDEGAVVAYADRVLDGAVPHRDFSTFYGPGNLWLVAGGFALFGADLHVERAIGLAYRLIVVFALFSLAGRLGGTVAAGLAGLTAALLMTYETIWAYATWGAMAFALLGLALATSGAAVAPGRRRLLVLLSAGVCAGLAALVRFDFVLAILISALPLFLFLPRRERLWYGAGFLATAGVYVPYFVVVGPAKVERVARDLIAIGSARRLPIPAPWEAPGDLLALAAVATAALVLVGAVATRRRPRELEGRAALAAGLLGLLLLPYVLSRADHAHVAPVAIVSVSLAPGLVLFLGARSARLSAGGRVGLTVAVVGATLVLAARYTDPELRRFGDPPRIDNAGRSFYVDDDSLPAQRVVAAAERLAARGDSLFVGPQDLRLADYNPTYIYFLLPKLAPASYYMEMNPNNANRDGSGLADELRAADWLILTSEFQGEDWFGPNPTLQYGPAEPNEVLRDLFCLRLESGQYRLYERCDRAGARP